ncbi:MAG TPA: L-seryl-tRNA(Sec) selenium transferase [Planctomycetaceae bacterium]|nr:L-seryl-tRNA(Sec) selenium transferase [Planctomycetaceae bacterium]
MSHQELLRTLPPVTELVDDGRMAGLIDESGRDAVVEWIRESLEEVRNWLVSQGEDECGESRESLGERVIDGVLGRSQLAGLRRFDPVVNATGVVLHTGLGRSPLSAESRKALDDLGGAGNVEVDLETGERRYRGHQLQAAWQALCGAEDSVVVNNNAAATLLTLQALCAGREVVISRGQLIEIGGSFRLPEIFQLSGAVLREVGTTNRTSVNDYAEAIGPETVAIMHVHTSNYKVIGFSDTPGIDLLAPLAHEHGLVAIDDIGSGAMVDVAQFGLPVEPTFAESLAAGADVVLGSGDKLLGGPQAGIILGKRQYVEPIRQFPLARAVRVGKLTLAALAATLDAYRRGEAISEVPVLRLLAATESELVARAEALAVSLGGVESLAVEAARETALVGGGSLPGAEMPTAVLAVEHSEISADELALRLRTGPVRMFTRIQHDRVLVDLRSVLSEDDQLVVEALTAVA